jgi:predicted signal transduction protein with EAL and GGDEF domain
MMDSLEPSIAAQVAALSAYQDLHFKVSKSYLRCHVHFLFSTTMIKAFFSLTRLRGAVRLISSAGTPAPIMAEAGMFSFEFRALEADTERR